MELIKERDYYAGTYTVVLKEDVKELKLNYAGNGDLYMSMTEGRRLDKKYGDSIFLDIREEDGSIYDAVYNLYYRISDKHKNNPVDLMDEDNNIVWLDDDRPKDEADKFIIQNYGEVIRLKFVRVSNHNKFDFSRKNSRSINIRFCMSGSRYEYYALEFDKFYKDLNKIETKVYKK